jgi:3-hydroxymyristoyl/3-hydroxydecanoyl-(acyl carrier protein) dehydratase
MTTSFEFAGHIPADHPALAGHFPGYPITPGVVLLNQVAQACGLWQPTARITAWPQVKFVSPLLPQEAYVIRLTPTASGTARFTLHVDTRLVASGQFTFELEGAQGT